MAGTLEGVGRSADQAIESARQSVSDTADTLETKARDSALKISQGLQSGLDAIGRVARAGGEKIKNKIDDARRVAGDLKNGAEAAINSVGDRVASIKKGVEEGTLQLIKEGGKVYVIAGDGVKYAMEKLENGQKMVATYVDGRIQYVKDTATDIKNGTIAVARAGQDAWNRGVAEGQAARAKPEKPASVATEGAEKIPETYTVKAGDTLTKIAKVLGKDNPTEYLNKLIAANKGMDVNKLSIGQQINIPKKA